MEQALEHRIRERAYEIWNAHGQIDGKAHDHWLAAEHEVLSSLSVSAPARIAEAAPRPGKRTRVKATKTSTATRAKS
jgi:hypothetical protein